ncbi:MAG: type I DNA topoisomerase [Actinomycetota bacterium]|nr:type I DNA topoisomerase [Actinomycetota bacterium]
MAKPLVIVESPAKAKTISKFLGSGYLVESSIGHIRDLPTSASEIPTALKKEKWARLGVDVENGFKPLYVVSDKKRAQVKRLKELVREASELYLATDEDREGESIAWHLVQVLAPRVPVRRMVFHEITESAINDAIEHTRSIDTDLVSAQEARRILDRLYGYEVSPVLWKKVKPALSAGRVQSVATRILVQRERERMSFSSASYCSVRAVGAKKGSSFEATLTALDSARVAVGRDFASDGHLDRSRLKNAKVVVLDERSAEAVAEALRPRSLHVDAVEQKPYRRSPAPPFRTSTLQQEAGRKLRFSSKRTMAAAQRLYEAGHITYMRTDSTYLAEAAVAQARSIILHTYGQEFMPKSARNYRNSVKNAQEAHEAIRPAGDRWAPPAEISRSVGSDEAKIYDLIWKRTIASQMTDATGTSVSVRFSAPLGMSTEVGSPAGEVLTPETAFLGASGTTIAHPGFLRVYVEDTDDGDDSGDEREAMLPAFSEGETVAISEVHTAGHATTPPPRFTEASLVKALEELGVGRPSTYASIISTIQDRGYVFKRGTALVPSFVAFAVVSLLEQYFGSLVDYNFTAELEDRLDKIANGEEPAVPYLEQFYFGNHVPGLKGMVESQLEEIDPRAINTIPLGTAPDGSECVIRVGRYGPFIQMGERTAPIPDGIAPDELNMDKALELLESVQSERFLGIHPELAEPVYVKVGRFGPFVQLGDADTLPKGVKPKTASLFSSMTPQTISLEQAVELLSLPRVVGVDPEGGQEVLAANGKFGPYIKRGATSRNLESEERIFSITLPEALELLATPQAGRGRRSSTSVELGVDPDGRKVVLRSGRFGPYLSDGEVNCSVKQFEVEEGLKLERAIELLAEKRASMPEGAAKAPRRRSTGTSTRKTATKAATTRTTRKASSTRKSNAD